jgi:dTDP-4-amino-4,6-dideoxygalactose transaminase
MINVFGSCVGKEELSELKDCIDRQWLGIGKKTEVFEKMMSSKIGMDFVAVDNGSNALYLAVKLLDLPKGSEVIIPAVTWVSCASAVILAGCRPVFADVDYQTINITNDTIEEVISRKTKAIMVVHYSGYPAIISTRLPVIADCAHAVDTYIMLDRNHIHVSCLSDISIFSFDSIKNVACGELGGIAGSEEYIKRARDMRYCGLVKSGLQASTEKARWWEYELKEPFIKMLPNDLTASIGIAQLNKLNKLQTRRKTIWDIYQSQLRLSWIDLPIEVPSGWQDSYFTYAIKVVSGHRDKLARYLLDNGIYTTVRYQPLHLYKQFGRQRRLPVAEELNETLLNLPLHPNLSDKDVEYIIDKIKKFK